MTTFRMPIQAHRGSPAWAPHYVEIPEFVLDASPPRRCADVALANHGQTLETLRERHGLGIAEAVAIACGLDLKSVLALCNDVTWLRLLAERLGWVREGEYGCCSTCRWWIPDQPVSSASPARGTGECWSGPIREKRIGRSTCSSWRAR